MKKIIILLLFILSLGWPILAQKTKVKPKTPNKIIFAVLNDGKTLEPLAKIENGKLLQAVSGGDDQAILKAFNKTYYKPKTIYNLIFGGNVAGTVVVVKNDPTAECSQNMAEATTTSTRTKLKGFVMGLATDLKLAKPGSGVRRLPTPAERAEIEKLVMAEFAKNKVSVKTLRSHNLTALDVDHDGKIEFVGSYWVATTATARAKLFFIADQLSGDKYSFGHSEFEIVKQEDVIIEIK